MTRKQEKESTVFEERSEKNATKSMRKEVRRKRNNKNKQMILNPTHITSQLKFGDVPRHMDLDANDIAGNDSSPSQFDPKNI